MPAPSTRGGVVEIPVDHGQRRHEHDRGERELGPDEGDRDREARELRVGQPGNVALNQPGLVEEEVQRAPGRVEHPGPDHGGDGTGQHPWQDHHRADERAAAEGCEQQPGGAKAGEDGERGRHGCEGGRVADRLPEVVAGDHLAVVREADERCGRQDHDHLVEAAVERIRHGVEREQQHEQQRRQHPQDGVALVAHRRGRSAGAGRRPRGAPVGPSGHAPRTSFRSSSQRFAPASMTSATLASPTKALAISGRK